MGTIEEVNKGTEERIYVSVRVRPLNGKEILRNDASDWECINDNTIIYKNATLNLSDRSMYPTAYTFDRVFRPDCSTREVYEQGAKDVAISVVGGMNSSVFAYGQTSSGKTYTMFGITEYAIADIYGYIDKHPERDFILKFSAMEIYNESVRDLLSLDSTPLRLLDDPERGTIVEKLTEEVLRDWDHVLELLSICEAQRQIGETSLNEMSSRSHQIIRLTIESSAREYLGRDSTNVLASAVNFVDLAGSERASQTLSAGTRLKEGCHINRSLLTLGTIIRKLSKGRNGHIPYRDSKLTRILQTSLGGNARTAIICTMSPARSHVEQSRNTLLFASCAKEVSTNAQVNIVMSDKALVKHLRREVARLESELRIPQSAFLPLNLSAALREKDLQIEKLEKEIKDLILQRDIAQSQVKNMLQMVRDDASSIEKVEVVHYPHLRVQNSQDPGIPEQETSILADPLSLDSDNRTFSDVNSRTSSEDHHFARIPYIDKNFVHNDAASPAARILIDSSNFSDSDSCHSWDEVEKQSNATSDDLCREVRCIETQESSNRGAKLPFKDKDKARFPHVSETAVSMESESYPLGNDQGFISPSSKDESEMNEDMGPVRVKVEIQEVISKEEEKKVNLVEEFRTIDFLDMPSIDRLSLTPRFDNDSSTRRSLKFSKSRSCNASIYADSASPWFRMTDYSENVSCCGSERESVGFERTLSLTNFCSNDQSSSLKDSQCSPINALDIEVDNPVEKFPTTKDVISNNDVVKEKTEFPIEKEVTINPENEIKSKAIESPKKNVKDVGLDPIDDECPVVPSWPMEFKRIQKEIIELWHACNVSLVHRTYFFLLFQGDPSDAIYLEVELRRLKFLKQKFSLGEKTVVNGRNVTLLSSEKDLRQERRMLSKLMLKKLSEDERGTLFLKWGISLKTKMRRLQLAHSVWAHTEDVNHISDSAFLVAKLVGLIEPGEAPDKEMFGLNFAPRCSTNTYGFKRSLVSLL